MGIRTNPDSDPEPETSSDDANSDADTPDEDSGHKSGETAKQRPSRKGSVFSEDVLKIEICGPSVDYLTVIDVPGIFRTATEGVTTKDDISMIRNMVRRYIENSRTVILAVLASNIDISNQEILTLAEEYDPDGERTLGIMTKPDLVPELSSKMAVCNIVNGKKKQLKLGYYVVRSRGADQGDADFGRREDMFKEAPWNSLPADRVGVRALKARLGELLGHMARREFPTLRKEINVKLQQAERDRTALGPSRKDEHEQRRFLSAIAGRFQGLVRQALEAQYAGNSAFDDSMELRLVTQVVNLADSFSEKFKDMSALREFNTVKDAVTAPTEEFDKPAESAVSSENENLDFAAAIDLEDYPELDGLISDGGVEEPEGGIMEWMKELYTRSRGMDISNINGTVWATAWKEQSSKWPSMSKTFMGKVIVIIHRFVLAALGSVCVDNNVRGELWAAIFDEILHRYEVGVQAAEFLVAAERDTKPYTLDHRFNEIRQQSRGQRIGNLLAQKVFANKGKPLVSIEEVQSATEKKSNIEDVVEKLHDDLEAYYDIAQKRFVDNLLNQAVNYRLLFGPSTPLSVLSQEWVIGLRAEQLEAIAGESPSVKEYRDLLDKKITDLNAAREILRQS